jgi:hypothetical protein
MRAINETAEPVGIVVDGESGWTECSFYIWCEWHSDVPIRQEYVVQPASRVQLQLDHQVPSWRGRLTVYDLASCSVLDQTDVPKIGRMVVKIDPATVAVDYATTVEVDSTLDQQDVPCSSP